MIFYAPTQSIVILDFSKLFSKIVSESNLIAKINFITYRLSISETNQSISPPPPSAPKNGLNSPKLTINGDHTLALASQRNGGKVSSVQPSMVGQKNLSNGKPSKGSSGKKNQCNKNEVITLNGDCTDHHSATAAVLNETIDRRTENKLQPPTVDPRLIHANKGIVAMSVLIQHLTFNVSDVVVLVVVAC